MTQSQPDIRQEAFEQFLKPSGGSETTSGIMADASIMDIIARYRQKLLVASTQLTQTYPAEKVWQLVPRANRQIEAGLSADEAIACLEKEVQFVNDNR